MLNLFGRKFPSENFPPVIVHVIYLLMSVTFCLIYNHMVIGVSDLRYDEYAGIYRVLEGNAIKAIQFRVLVPLIFKAFKILHIPDRAILIFIFVAFTYFTLIFFYLILNIHFRDKVFNSILALALFYPMFWNFILLNQIYFYVEQSTLFFLVAGFYFLLKKKNVWLLITFLIGAFNHPSVIMLIPVYLLFNYNRLLKKDTIIYSVLLVGGYYVCFLVLKMLYPYFPADRDADYGLIHFSDTVIALRDLPKHLIIRDIVFNFGGLHIFAAMFFISGIWKKFKREYVFIYFLIIPYVMLAVLRAGIRVEEMRNWIPLLPFIILPALLYLSQIKNPLLKLSDEVTMETGTEAKI